MDPSLDLSRVPTDEELLLVSNMALLGLLQLLMSFTSKKGVCSLVGEVFGVGYRDTGAEPTLMVGMREHPSAVKRKEHLVSGLK